MTEKGTYAYLNDRNVGNPLGYLLRAELNQYTSNNYRGMAARYDFIDPHELEEIQNDFLDYDNDPCSLTEYNFDLVAGHLSNDGRRVLELLLLGNSKTEVYMQLGFYRGKTGRILRNEVIPTAESVFAH